MKNIVIICYLLFAALYGQWALWGNPSLPGGSSDKGLGADKNEIYFSLTQSTQFIDWWHAPLQGEDFDHKGDLISFMIRPGVIYGLSNKINISLNTAIGIRKMNFFSDNQSIHHRDEHTHDDFDNAEGGLLGDSKLMIRYLIKNAGAGDGFRIIFGSGATIPSKNVLTKNPFLKINGEYIPHRHFSMSNGTYNFITDFQMYYKRSSNPVFFGGNISIEKPLAENDYYYLPPTSVKAVFSSIFKRFDKLDGAIDLSLGIESLSEGYWKNIPSPNSSALIVVPSLGYLFNVKKGAISISIQKPVFISGSFGLNDGDIKQETKFWQLILSYRSLPYKIN